MSEIKPNSQAGVNALVATVISAKQQETPEYYDFVANSVQLGHGHRLYKTYPNQSIQSQATLPVMTAPETIKAGTMLMMDIKHLLNAIQHYDITDATDLQIMSIATTGTARVIFKTDVTAS